MSPVAPFLAPERDASLKVGRSKGGGQTDYTIPGVAMADSINTNTFTAGRDAYFAWHTDTPIVIDQLAFEVTTGVAGNARVGIYRANTDWQPIGAPLVDSGDISVTAAGVKTYTPGTPIYIRRGRYLSIYNSSVNAGLRVYRGQPLAVVIDAGMGASPIVDFVYVTRAYAAFPTPGTAWDTRVLGSGTTGFQPIVMRISTP